MAANKYTDTDETPDKSPGGRTNREPVDFHACANACFAAPSQGLSHTQLAANLAQMNGINAPAPGRQL